MRNSSETVCMVCQEEACVFSKKSAWSCLITSFLTCWSAEAKAYGQFQHAASKKKEEPKSILTSEAKESQPCTAGPSQGTLMRIIFDTSIHSKMSFSKAAQHEQMLSLTMLTSISFLCLPLNPLWLWFDARPGFLVRSVPGVFKAGNIPRGICIQKKMN